MTDMKNDSASTDLVTTPVGTAGPGWTMADLIAPQLSVPPTDVKFMRINWQEKGGRGNEVFFADGEVPPIGSMCAMRLVAIEDGKLVFQLAPIAAA